MKNIMPPSRALPYIVAILLVLGAVLIIVGLARGAQGPAAVDMPRPAAITFLPVYDSTGGLVGLSATTTASILMAVPSGVVERRTQSITIDLFDMALQEVGSGKSRTTYREIGADVVAMVNQEIQRRYPSPLPVESTVQSGRQAVRMP